MVADTLKAQLTGPLRIDHVATPGGGTLGMVHCPGRCVSPWQRDLSADIAAIRDWGASSVVSLVRGSEFALLGVPEFPRAMLLSGLGWHHIPIEDMSIPSDQTLKAWRQSGQEILDALKGGQRVVLHCAAGLGRTGTMAAKMLVGFGVSPEDAIASVRQARPGPIETAAQEQYIRTGAPLPLW